MTNKGCPKSVAPSKMIRQEILPVFFSVKEFQFSDNGARSVLGAWYALMSFLLTIKTPQGSELRHKL